MSKGFALTLSVIILIFFLTLILTVEAQRIAVDEETRSLHAQLTAATALFSDIDSPALDYSFEKLAKRSLYDIDMEIINTSKYATDDIDGPEGLLCKNFTAKLEGYLKSLEMRAADSGLTLTYEAPTCNSELTGPFTATLSFSAPITVQSDSIYATKSLEREMEFSIEGLPDPVITLEAKKEYQEQRVYRPVIESSIEIWDEANEEYLLKPDEKGNAQYGQGWVYGEVITSAGALNLSSAEWAKYILFIDGTKGELAKWGANNLTAFRGVILRSTASESETLENFTGIAGTDDGVSCPLVLDMEIWFEEQPCINCGSYVHARKDSATPAGCDINWASLLADSHYQKGSTYYWYSSSGGISLEETPFAVVTGTFKTGDKVLINSPSNEVPAHADVGVYDIEQIRGAVLCGNYFARDYYNTEEVSTGPDFFQRLQGDLDSNSQYGIETFVSGHWAKREYSKIDWEYYGADHKAGIPVKGLPSCRDEFMCTDREDDQIFIGRFRINDNNDDLLDAYGMEDILYD